MLFATLVGWLSRHQQDVIAYLVEENRMLKERLERKPLRLNNDQCRRLAAKAKQLGRQVLNRIATNRDAGFLGRDNPKARYTVNRMAKFASFGTRFLPRRFLDALLRIQFRVPRPEHVK